MKSLIAALAPTVAAVIQAMGLYQYLLIKPMAVSGMVFFPILFTLMVAYIQWRRSVSRKQALRAQATTQPSGGSQASARPAPAETPYSLMHTILLVVGVLLLVATIIGQAAHQPVLYPSLWWYYGGLLLVVLETAFCIAGLPKKVKPEKPGKAKKKAKTSSRRRRQPAGAGPTHLVAKSKGSTSSPSTTSAETSENA